MGDQIGGAVGIASMIGGGSPLDWAKAAVPLLGALGGGNAPPAAPATSGIGGSGSKFDNSGWTVATGRASASQVAPFNVSWPWLVGGALLAILIYKKA